MEMRETCRCGAFMGNTGGREIVWRTQVGSGDMWGGGM